MLRRKGRGPVEEVVLNLKPEKQFMLPSDDFSSVSLNLSLNLSEPHFPLPLDGDHTYMIGFF